MTPEEQVKIADGLDAFFKGAGISGWGGEVNDDVADVFILCPLHHHLEIIRKRFKIEMAVCVDEMDVRRPTDLRGQCGDVRQGHVDHEGEVLEVFVTKKRDRKAALRFLRKAMKRYGSP